MDNQEGARVWAYTVKGYDDPALDRAVEAIFAHSAAARALGPGVRVLLKPNLLAKHEPGAAVTTHPAVVRAVVKALRRRGCDTITLADSSGGPYTAALMKSLYRVSGLAAVCEEEGVNLWLGTGSAPRQNPEGALVHTFTLIDPVLEADFIVNLPKVKTHMLTYVTCGVKNLFGCIPGLLKAEMHTRFPEKSRFGDMLVDLERLIRPALTVADGILAMEGDGPAGGRPVALNLLLGGEDVYALDLAVCRVMGADPARVPPLSAAMQRGICPPALPDGWVGGDAGACDPRQGFALPTSYKATSGVQSAALRWSRGPIGRLAAPHPKINRGRCVGCGACRDICPAHTIALENGKARIDQKACIRCFCCHEVCPVKAIDVKRLRIFDR